MRQESVYQMKKSSFHQVKHFLARDNSKIDSTALFLKAEAMFNLCDFEHALVFYHKGRQQYKTRQASKYIAVCLAARINPESSEFQHGIAECTSAITRPLDSPNCFEDAESAIRMDGVAKSLALPHFVKGTVKKEAILRFKRLIEPNINKENKEIILIHDKEKKKKDPLDLDKEFLEGLVLELGGRRDR